MQGTVDHCKRVGFTPEQSELIGKMDDLFEEAQTLGLVTGDQAQEIGVFVGKMMYTTTGKQL